MIRKLQSVSAFALSAWVALPLLSWQSEPVRIDSPQHQLELAVSYYNSGNYQDAARVLEDLARRAPGNFQVEELTGLVYSAQGKDQEACLHFEKAVRLNPRSAPLRTNLAVSLARLGKNELAEAEFKKAVEAEPGDFSVNHNFGEFYARNGNAKAAIPYLQRAQKARPSSYGNGYDLALAYVQAGMWEDARQQIQAMIKIKDTAELHDLMGEVEEKKGNYVAAANEYQRAAQMDPSESNIFYWGGELLLHQTWNPAVEVFSKGVERYPKSQRLVVGLGLSLFWSGRYDEAVRVLVKATDLAPADPRPYYFLSKAYQHSHSLADEVIDRFRRYAELRPQDGQAAYYYAMSLWKGKESDNNDPALKQAESLLKRAIQLSPSFAEAHLALANLYSQERKYAEAVPEYQRAIELDAKVADAYYRLGQAYVHLNRPDLAKKEFEVHDQLYQQHLAEWDNRQREVLRFVVSQRSGTSTRP
ncbi:MAG TPA: tetratricopeptide repeat protein [Terriglobia bacterium]|nr:tetratricopeptide repeat protein [Terriglobia bacterium]